MSVIEIPRSFKYVCDRCGKEHLQENAGGHYTDSRPPLWSKLTLARDATDYQGQAVADGTARLLLCEGCTVSLATMINDWGRRL